MEYLIRFNTNKFNLEEEKENSINPIHGYSVGEWLKPILEGNNINVTKIDDEDWGWYCYATVDSQKYLIGFIALPGDNEKAQIMIQIHKERSFFERLFGKNKLSSNEALIKIISSIISSTVDFENIIEEYQYSKVV